MCIKNLVVATYVGEFLKTILSIKTENLNLREIVFEKTKKNQK